MNGEIEYAEMLEIPVSTVNVIKKKSRRGRGSSEPMKERLIRRVNDRVESASSEDAPAPESLPYAGGLDTLSIESEPPKKSRRFKRAKKEEAEEEFALNERGMYEVKKPPKKSGVLLTVEFALCCALCATIFLTNVFMPTSAINTFFKSLVPSQTQADTRNYSDFTLTSVVSEGTDAEFSVSPTGVLTFTKECCVYPAVDGKVSEITKNSDGTYDVKISHTDTFYGVLGGLNYVYYNVGDKVYSNVPVGYSEGETAVRVTMYSGDTLLNCYTVNEANCLVWSNAEA